MYIFEIINKKLLQIFKREKQVYNPLDENSGQEDDEFCEHVFMPIDTTGEVLVCNKCGFLIHKQDLKSKKFLQ